MGKPLPITISIGVDPAIEIGACFEPPTTPLGFNELGIAGKAVTHRRNPILQTCIGPSEEHVNMAGIPTEARIIQMVEKAMPGRLLNVYAHSAGGGKYMAVLQLKEQFQRAKFRDVDLKRFMP